MRFSARSFYLPQIFAGESYKVTLTETVDGNSKSYSKGVTANESENWYAGICN